MARIVFGGGTSHTPLVTLKGELWEEYAKNDQKANHYFDLEGNFISYQDLKEQAGDKYLEVCTNEYLEKQAEAVERHLDRLASDIARTAPDVMVIVGDDQQEMFQFDNMPAVSIFYGDKIISHKWPESFLQHRPIFSNVVKGYGMEEYHTWQGASSFSLELIEKLIERNVDVAAAKEVMDPEKAGFGHAFGFVITRLFGGKTIPVVPVLLNTYFPPNQPTCGRAYDIGRILREIIEASPTDLKVGIIASGGLSHFVTNEPLDRQVMEALRTGNSECLRKLPPQLLKEGSSEIKNWIVVGGAFEGRATSWNEYLPVYRTPAGTGVGIGFASWS
jgi:hypothetical protein